MRKKLPLIILLVTVVLQICVPAGFIVYQEIEEHIIISKGEVYRFRINGLYVLPNALSFDVALSHNSIGNQYLIVSHGDDGFAKQTFTNEKPDTVHYIKSAKKHEHDRFSFYSPRIDTDTYENLADVIFIKQETSGYIPPEDGFAFFKEAYMDAYVYKGKTVISKVYIDSVEASEYLQQLNDIMGG